LSEKHAIKELLKSFRRLKALFSRSHKLLRN
jgi:hypothetical protein